MSSSKLPTARRHHGEARRQRLGDVAEVGGEREQSEHAEADEEDAAPGQNQQRVDVVSVTDVLDLVLLLLLDQVTVLVPLRDLERILIHLHSETQPHSLFVLLRITAYYCVLLRNTA